MDGATTRDELLRGLTSRSASIASTVIDRLHANIDSYQVVPRAELEESIGEIVQLAADVLRAGVVPPVGGVGQARRSAAARAAQNIPIHDIIRAFRFTVGGIHEALLEAADVPAPELIDITTVLWRFSDAYTASQVAVHQASDLERALARVRRAQLFLQDLIDGSVDQEAITRSAGSLGLDPDARYRAVRARPVDPDRLRELLQTRAVRQGRPALYAVAGRDVVGVAEQIPLLDDPTETVAIGEPGPLAAMTTSFRTAANLLASAGPLGRSGVVTVADLSWRLAALQSTEVDRLLRERYLRPLEAQGTFGDLVADTVRAYLRADRNIPRAAQAVPVHVNTLRYRLRRFEELTGRSLDSTDTIVEVSFALEVTAQSPSQTGDPSA